jgi:hypothetical protein
MDKNEYIAEAKKRGFSDSEIQKLLHLYEQCALKGSPVVYGFADYNFPEEGGVLSDDDIEGLFISEETL